MIEGSIRLTVAGDGARVAQRLGQLPGARVASIEANTIALACADVTATLVQVVNALRELNVELFELRTQEPNLEQVFLNLTEKALRD
jgi:ABC-2 type transport system ATP-binding protein